MNTYLKQITTYFDEEKIFYEYKNISNSLVFHFKFENSETKLKAHILEFNEIFQVYIGTFIKEYEALSEDNINKISEYIHRANLGMIRGNFEYNIDKGIIVFKHYFEKSSVMNKKYAMYNIFLPIAMFLKYITRLSELINTSKSPTELIKEVEADDKKEMVLKLLKKDIWGKQ